MDDDDPPAATYFDTSIVLAALFEDMAHFDASTAFCARQQAARGRVVFSEILWLELSQVLARLHQDPQLPDVLRRTYRLHRWDASAEVRVRWLEAGVRRFEDLMGGFAAVEEVGFNRAIWRASIDIMAQTNLRSHDAIHVATARSVGVRDFATVDSHFRRVPDLNVRLIRDPSP